MEPGIGELGATGGTSQAMENREQVWKKDLWPWDGHWTRREPNQSDDNFIPNDNILGMLLLPWSEFLHFDTPEGVCLSVLPKQKHNSSVTDVKLSLSALIV